MPEPTTLTAAPAAESTPSPAPAAAPAPPSDPWTAVDAKLAARSTPAPSPEATDTTEDEAAMGVKDTDTADAPAEKPAEEKSLLDSLDELNEKPEEKKEDAKPPEKPADKLADKEWKAPKEMREAIKKAQSEAKAKSDQVAQLEAKIKEYESRGQDTTALTERLAAREKELESMRGELSLLKFQESDDWKKNYETPFNMAAEMTKQDVSQLVVTDADGNQRQATWDDFVALYNMPKGKAYERATEMFGPAAQLVTQHLTELKRLDFMGQQAKEAERKGWSERVKAEQAKAVQEREAVQAMWARVNDDLSKRVKDYADAPDDSEAAEMRKEGYALFDAEPKTLQDRVVREAHVRHRVAAFNVLKLQNARLTEKLAALEKEVAAFKSSKPTLDTKRQADSPKKGGDSIWDSFPNPE